MKTSQQCSSLTQACGSTEKVSIEATYELSTPTPNIGLFRGGLEISTSCTAKLCDVLRLNEAGYSIAKLLVRYMRKNHRELGVKQVSDISRSGTDRFTFYITLARQDLPISHKPTNSLVSIQLSFHLSTSPGGEYESPGALDRSFNLLINEAIHDFVRSQLIKRFPALFGARDEEHTESANHRLVARSILAMASRSSHEELHEGLQRLARVCEAKFPSHSLLKDEDEMWSCPMGESLVEDRSNRQERLLCSCLSWLASTNYGMRAYQGKKLDKIPKEGLNFITLSMSPYGADSPLKIDYAGVSRDALRPYMTNTTAFHFLPADLKFSTFSSSDYYATMSSPTTPCLNPSVHKNNGSGGEWAQPGTFQFWKTDVNLQSEGHLTLIDNHPSPLPAEIVLETEFQEHTHLDRQDDWDLENVTRGHPSYLCKIQLWKPSILWTLLRRKALV